MSLYTISGTPCRDALAKALYSQLFTWLVGRINQVTCKHQKEASIAILDIFGFEVSYPG